MSASLTAMRDWLGGLFARKALAIPPVPPPAAAPVHDAVTTTVAVAPDARLLGKLGLRDAAAWSSVLVPACAAQGISSRTRLAHFLATVLHESGDLTRLTESLNYSVDAILRAWPTRFTSADAQRWGRGPNQAANERAIAERAYGGRLGNGREGCGDGYRFRGRGLIQITGRANYEAAAEAMDQALDTLPGWLETREGAARSAAWWWRMNGCNELADANDIVALRRRVNGGLLGLDDVRARHERILAALAG